MSAAKPARSLLLKRLLGVLIAAACVTSMATGGNALEPLSRPLTPHRPPRVLTPEECAKLTLTTDEYLDRLHAVVMHGDLRDAPFVEKTLQVKFYAPKTYGRGSDYFPVVKSSPYTAILSVGKTGAALWMGVPAFKNCKHLTRAIVASHFPGPFLPVGSHPTINIESTIIHVKGKDLKLTYEYDDNNNISNPKLTQIAASNDK